MVSGKKIMIVLLLLLAMLYGCKKNTELQAEKITGKIACTVKVKHHNWEVPGLKVSLKANTTVFPGYDDTQYDRFLVTDTYGNVTFDSLFPGNFYLFSKGFDIIWGDTVIGYAPLVLNESTISNNTLSTTLYVSE